MAGLSGGACRLWTGLEPLQTGRGVQPQLLPEGGGGALVPSLLCTVGVRGLSAALYSSLAATAPRNLSVQQSAAPRPARPPGHTS